MYSIVIPAVTRPSATQVRIAKRVNFIRQGRTSISSTTAAQNSRSQTTPSAPIRADSCTDAATPNWTHDIDATAMTVPVRAAPGDA
jgi:hypothetical protein